MKLLVFLLTLGLILTNFAAPPSAYARQAGARESALREQGKKIFAQRCGQCHDADANKQLPDGTTLLRRLAMSKDPEARLGTRLKDPQERRAVFVYIDSLLKQAPSPR